MGNGLTRREFAVGLAGLGLMQGCEPVSTPDTRGWSGVSTEELYRIAKEEGAIYLYTNTEQAAVSDIRRGFEQAFPGIETVPYTMTGAHTLNKFLSEAAAGRYVADLVVSSTMDAQAYLVSAGHAAHYDSPEDVFYPPAGDGQGYLHPISFEPIVLIANTRLLKGRRIPQSHRELVYELTHNPSDWFRKVATSDPEKGSTGFLFFAQSPYSDPSLDEVVSALAGVEARRYSTTSNILERVMSGEQFLGYNCLGSYTMPTIKANRYLQIIYPSDFTAVLSRLAMINKNAPHPAAARLFLNYLLSSDGQNALRPHYLYPIRQDLTGAGTANRLKAELGDRLSPIPIDSRLQNTMGSKQRLAFIRAWRKAFSG